MVYWQRCVLVLVYYFKNILSLVLTLMVLKAFLSTLNSRIGQLENSIFDVTNRARTTK